MAVQANERALSYVREALARNVPQNYSSDITFVDGWMYDLYEILTPPDERYTDIRQQQEGYNNLLYNGKAITRKSRP